MTASVSVEATFDSFAEGYWNGYSYCAVKNSTAVCLGDDGENQISDTPFTQFDSFYIGEEVFCGRTAGGALTCWGKDNHGQVSDTSSSAFQQVVVAGSTVCGLGSHNSIECWGHDQYDEVSNSPL